MSKWAHVLKNIFPYTADSCIRRSLSPADNKDTLFSHLWLVFYLDSCLWRSIWKSWNPLEPMSLNYHFRCVSSRRTEYQDELANFFLPSKQTYYYIGKVITPTAQLPARYKRRYKNQNKMQSEDQGKPFFLILNWISNFDI